MTERCGRVVVVVVISAICVVAAAQQTQPLRLQPLRMEVCATPTPPEPPPETEVPPPPPIGIPPEPGQPFQPTPEAQPIPRTLDWFFQNPCDPCDPIADEIDALKAGLQKLLRTLDELQVKLDAAEADIRKIRARVNAINQRLEGTAGTGGSIYDPETRTTIEGHDQGDGTYLFTVRDSRGRIIDQYTRPVRSQAQLRRERDELEGQLEISEGKSKKISAEIGALQKAIDQVTLQIAALVKDLERCIATLCAAVVTVIPFDPEGDLFTPDGVRRKFPPVEGPTPPPPPPVSADLEIVKSAPSTVPRGGSLPFGLEVTNRGPANATGVRVADVLPRGLNFGGATPSQGTCAFSDGTLSCSLGMIPSGGRARVEVPTTVSDSASGTLTNTATVTGDQTDPVTINNSATTTTRVEAPAPPQNADLSISKRDSVDPVIAGNSFTYFLDVRNAGPDSAAGVTMNDSLPPGLNATGTTTTRGSCTTSGSMVSCQIGDLAAMANAQIEISVQTSPSLTGTVSNTASVTGTSTDPNGANNQASETTLIAPPQNCALNIVPGLYTGDAACGSNGSVTISCSGTHEVILADGFRVVCNSSGDCGTNNVIFSRANHDCDVIIENGRPCLVCRELTAEGQPTGRQCRECFTRNP